MEETVTLEVEVPDRSFVQQVADETGEGIDETFDQLLRDTAANLDAVEEVREDMDMVPIGVSAETAEMFEDMDAWGPEEQNAESLLSWTLSIVYLQHLGGEL